MTDDQIALIQSSFAKVVPEAPAVADLFYGRLFVLDPSLRPMFPESLREQGMKLMAMLSAIVKGLRDLPALVPVAQALAVRHVRYGVKPAHYATVGAALLWTLEQGLGADFTPEVKAAWTEAYGILSSVMIDAGDAAMAAAGTTA